MLKRDNTPYMYLKEINAPRDMHTQRCSCFVWQVFACIDCPLLVDRAPLTLEGKYVRIFKNFALYTFLLLI